ncbi:hypothetical protein [Lacrimispora amygdalina]|uniref:hypothetical protein n=1 Tax=Lacrimispora amygdalina TaxID=253257 RepID=UPI000BE24F07|nr:hypothetical protein [Lacrimispora amygdalina]
MFGLITKKKLQEKIEECELRMAGDNAKEKYNLLEKLLETKDELKKLKQQLEVAPKRLSDININAKCREMADNAWYGKPHYLLYADLNGNPVLSLCGYTYEPSHECFSATCSVSGFDSTGNEYTLGSDEDIRDYIKNRDSYVIVKSYQ